MKEKISISCKCTTYGRVAFLEEALQSFLLQEYDGEKEFLIVNDYPLQTLHFDHPDVRIINLKETFPMIGQKEDFAIGECKFDTVYNSDDDDVFLPNTLEQINRFFPGRQLLHWNRGILMVSNKIAAIGSTGNCGIVYDRKFVKENIGTYYPLEHEGADMTLVRSIQIHKGTVVRVAIPDEEVCQVYNWGNGSFHLSGQGSYKEGRENIIIRHSRHIEEQRKKGKIPTGDIELKPHWKRDYSQMLRDFPKRQK